MKPASVWFHLHLSTILLLAVELLQKNEHAGSPFPFSRWDNHKNEKRETSRLGAELKCTTFSVWSEDKQAFLGGVGVHQNFACPCRQGANRKSGGCTYSGHCHSDSLGLQDLPWWKDGGRGRNTDGWVEEGKGRQNTRRELKQERNKALPLTDAKKLLQLFLWQTDSAKIPSGFGLFFFKLNMKFQVYCFALQRWKLCHTH